MLLNYSDNSTMLRYALINTNIVNNTRKVKYEIRVI